jgi:hypothetical protein
LNISSSNTAVRDSDQHVVVAEALFIREEFSSSAPVLHGVGGYSLDSHRAHLLAALVDEHLEAVGENVGITPSRADRP